MCHDYSTAHRKFQAARYKSPYGILHIRKHLTESQIVEYLFEVLVSDIMAHNDVFSSRDLIFAHRGGCRVELRTHLLLYFPRGRYPPNIYLSCQWFFHNYFSSRAIVRVSVSYGLFPVLLPQTLFQSLYSFSPIGHLRRGQFFVPLLLATAVVATAVTFIIGLCFLLSRFV